MGVVAAQRGEAPSVVLRAPIEDDWAYIRDSWKKSFRDFGGERHIPAHLYWPNRVAEIDNYVREAKFRVASDADDSNFIWGWACVEPPALHYVFVRTSARGQGVAGVLTADLPRPLVISHWTTFAEAVQRKHPGVFLYEPSRRRR